MLRYIITYALQQAEILRCKFAISSLDAWPITTVSSRKCVQKPWPFETIEISFFSRSIDVRFPCTAAGYRWKHIVHFRWITRGWTRAKQRGTLRAGELERDEPTAKRVCGFQLFKWEQQQQPRQQLRQPCIDHHCRLLRDRPAERTNQGTNENKRKERSVLPDARIPSSIIHHPVVLPASTDAPMARPCVPDH